MGEDKWEKYRNMTKEELQETVNDDLDAQDYVYFEYNDDDIHNPLETAMLRDQGFTEEDIEELENMENENEY